MSSQTFGKPNCWVLTLDTTLCTFEQELQCLKWNTCQTLTGEIPLCQKHFSRQRKKAAKKFPRFPPFLLDTTCVTIQTLSSHFLLPGDLAEVQKFVPIKATCQELKCWTISKQVVWSLYTCRSNSRSELEMENKMTNNDKYASGMHSSNLPRWLIRLCSLLHLFSFNLSLAWM